MCPERYFWSLSFNKRRLQQQSTMVATGAKLVISLLFVGALYTTDADITAWTEPGIAGAADGAGTLSLAENQATDTTIKTYKATTGATSVTYALTPAVSPFALTAGGVLTITSALDHETTPTYTLLIVATDDGGAKGTATITVTVTDVNEHDPVFSAASYSACIADKSTAGTTLTTVTATDKDTSQKITYAISSGNTNTDFKIDATGLIKVNDAKTLNQTTTATYTLVVTAADNVATVKTGSSTVSVTVADSCKSGTEVAAVSMMILIVSLFVTLF